MVGGSSQYQMSYACAHCDVKRRLQGPHVCPVCVAPLCAECARERPGELKQCALCRHPVLCPVVNCGAYYCAAGAVFCLSCGPLLGLRDHKHRRAGLRPACQRCQGRLCPSCHRVLVDGQCFGCNVRVVPLPSDDDEWLEQRRPEAPPPVRSAPQDYAQRPAARQMTYDERQTVRRQPGGLGGAGQRSIPGRFGATG